MTAPDTFRPPVIVTEGLTRRFGSFTAVNRVSLSVPEGSIFGLLGPNGSGKTTVIRMLCGVLEQSEGTAEVLGLEMPRQAPELKHIIGYMSQMAGTYDDMTIREHLRFYAGLYGLTRRQTVEATDRVVAMARLEAWVDTLAGAVPVGTRQDLAFACASIHAPTLLFLDEPTADMSPVARRTFWDGLYCVSSAHVILLDFSNRNADAPRS